MPQVHPSTSEFFVGDSNSSESKSKNNAFLERYNNPIPKDWPRFKGSGNVKGNYWGTTSPTIIDAMIWDFNDDITLGTITYQPILTTAPVTAYPFVVDVALTTADGKPVSIVGAETVTFTVAFNRDMDQAVAPAVSFGPSEPYTDYTISPGTLTRLNDTKFAVTGVWKDARTWVGSFKVNPITGDGYQYIRVAGAVAANDPWLVTGVDSARFRFEIITSGTESMNLAAGGGEGKVILSWTQNDFELLTGYNLYRSTKATEGFTRINSTLIAKQTTGYLDTTVNPGLTYYYKFTVVKSDGTESASFSNVASAAAVDTIAPMISHVPLTSSPAGLAVSLTSQVTDNVGVQEVLLHFRTIGAATYTARAMTNTMGSTYAATIEGSAMTAPGVDYYITASDGVSPANFGRPEAPYQIRVLDTPVITGVSPMTGGATGGTAVTLAGANFKTGASVTFGGALATNVVVVSANQITCTTPTHFPSAVDVVVTNPGVATGALLRAYTFTSDQASLSFPVLSAGQNTVIQIHRCSSCLYW
ncbi:MAG: IPT/TIG domain-containing protein [Betaproteobacteria bacterium]